MPITFLDEEEDIAPLATPAKRKITFLDEEEEIAPATPQAAQPSVTQPSPYKYDPARFRPKGLAAPKAEQEIGTLEGIANAARNAFDSSRQALDIVGDVTPEEAKNIAKIEFDKQSRKVAPGYDEYQKAEGFDAVLAFAKNPIEVTSNIVAEGLAGSLPALGAGLAAGGVGAAIGAPTVIGAPIGFTAGQVAGTFAGSLATEYGSKILEEMQEGGVDLTKPESIQGFFENEEAVAAARDKAISRGIPVAAFDAISAGIGGKLGRVIGKQFLTKTGEAAAELGVQAGLGGGGEVAGALAAGEPIEGKAVFAEVIGEAGPGAAEIITGRMADRAARVKAEEDAKIKAAAQLSDNLEQNSAPLTAAAVKSTTATTIEQDKLAAQLEEQLDADEIEKQVSGQLAVTKEPTAAPPAIQSKEEFAAIYSQVAPEELDAAEAGFTNTLATAATEEARANAQNALEAIKEVKATVTPPAPTVEPTITPAVTPAVPAAQPPITDATQEIIQPEGVRQEPQDGTQVQPTEEAGVGDSLLGAARGQEEGQVVPAAPAIPEAITRAIEERRPISAPFVLQYGVDLPRGWRYEDDFFVPPAEPAPAAEVAVPVTPAPVEPTAIVEQTPTAEKPLEVQPAEQEALLGEAQSRYDSEIATYKNQRRINLIDDQELGKKLKAAGMRFAAEKRKITGQLTEKESEAEAKREASNYIGKLVEVDGRPGKVIGNPFGRVRVKLDEGGATITATPEKVMARSAIAPEPIISEIPPTSELVGAEPTQPTIREVPEISPIVGAEPAAIVEQEPVAPAESAVEVAKRTDFTTAATREEAGEIGRNIASQDPSLPPPPPPQFEVLESISNSQSRKAYNPDVLTEEAINEARENGFIIGKKVGKFRFTESGRNQLREWSDQARDRSLALDALRDEIGDIAVSQWDTANAPESAAAIAARTAPAPVTTPPVTEAVTPAAEQPAVSIPASGKPFEFFSIRNKEKAPSLGTQFGQDVEPSGKYISQSTPDAAKNLDARFEKKTVRFENPLVVEFGGEYGTPTNWKNVLSSQYGGKTGKELSQAIRDAGYDGIVTVEPAKGPNRPASTSEIVDISSLKPKKQIVAPTPAAPAEPAAEPSGISVGNRIKLGKSPQTYTIEEVIPQSATERELGEQYYSVKNERTGEKQVVEARDLRQVKGKGARKIAASQMTPATQEEIAAFNKASSNKVMARNPQLAVAAVRLKNGKITASEYADLIDSLDPFNVKGAEAIPAKEKIDQYIDEPKLEKVNAPIQQGKEVEFRIDIPTYNRSTAAGDTVYAVTAHEPVPETSTRVGTPISYLGVAKVINPKMMTRSISGKGEAIDIATGAGKFPLATVKGNYEAITELPTDINDPNVWTEVSYNPIRSSYFVDVRSKNAVVGGDEAIMVGSRVFVKNPQIQARPTGIVGGEGVRDIRYISEENILTTPPDQQYTFEEVFDVAYDMFGGEIPEGFTIVNDSKDKDFEFKAAYIPESGEIIVNLAYLNKSDDIRDTITHELGHYIFGDPEFRAAFDQFIASLSPEARADLDAYVETAYNKYTGEIRLEEKMVRAFVDQFINEEQAPAWRSMLDAIKRFLNKLGFKFNISDRDAISVFTAALDRYKAGEAISREGGARLMAAEPRREQVAGMEREEARYITTPEGIIKQTNDVLREKFFDGTTVSPEKTTEAWGYISRLLDIKSGAANEFAGQINDVVDQDTNSEARMGASLFSVSLANYAAKLAAQGDSKMLKYMIRNVNSMPTDKYAGGKSDAGRALRSAKEYDIDGYGAIKIEVKAKVERTAATLFGTGSPTDAQVKAVEGAIKESDAQELGNPEEVAQEVEKVEKRTKRKITDKIEKIIGKGSLKGIIQAIKETPLEKQQEAGWIEKVVNDFLVNAGLSPEVATTASKLYESLIAERLAEARQKAFEDNLNKSAPWKDYLARNSRLAKDALKKLQEAIRTGALDPEQNVESIIAAESGWSGFTKDQYQKIVQLDSIINDPKQDDVTRREAMADLNKVISNAKLPVRFKDALGAYYVGNALMGIPTLTVNIASPIGFTIRNLMTDVGKFAFTDPARIPVAFETFLDSMRSWYDQTSYAFKNQIYMNDVVEYLQGQNVLRELFDKGKKQWAEGKYAEGFVNMAVGMTQITGRVLSSLDQGAISMLENQNITRYAMEALANTKGKVPKDKLKEFANMVIDTRRKTIAQSIANGMSRDRAGVLADLAVKSEVISALAQYDINPMNVLDASINDALQSVGRNKTLTIKGVEQSQQKISDSGFLSYLPIKMLENVAEASGREGSAMQIFAKMLYGFALVPSRVFHNVAWFSPYGFIRLGIDKYKKNKGEDSPYAMSLQTEAQYRQRLTDSIAGSIAMLGLAALSSASTDEDEDKKFKIVITGNGPSATTDKQYFDSWMKKWKPYSVHIVVNGNIIPINIGRGGEALFFPIMLAGALDDWKIKQKQNLTKKEPEDLSAIAQMLGSSFFALAQRGPYAAFTKPLFDASKDGRVTEELASQAGFFGKTFIPVVGSSLARNISDLFNDPVDRSSIEGAIYANTPVVGPWLGTKALNALGQPIRADDWGDKLYKLGVPVVFSFPKETPMNALNELILKQGSGPTIPTRANAQKRFGDVITDKEFETYVREYGRVMSDKMFKSRTKLANMKPADYDDELEKYARGYSIDGIKIKGASDSAVLAVKRMRQ